MGDWKVLTLACIFAISNCDRELKTTNSPWISRNLEKIESRSVSNCVCFPTSNREKAVTNKLKPNGGELERLVVYVYKDKNINKLWIYIPNYTTQSDLPDLPYDEGTLLTPSENQHLYDFILTNPSVISKITSPENISITVNGAEPEINSLGEVQKFTPESLVDPSHQNIEPSPKDSETPLDVENNISETTHNNFITSHGDVPKDYLSGEPFGFYNLNAQAQLPFSTETTHYLIHNNAPRAFKINGAYNQYYSQYDSVPNIPLDQSKTFPINDMVKLQNYFLFNGMDAKLLSDQVMRILKANNINWTVAELLTNGDTLPKLSFVPVLKQDHVKHTNSVDEDSITKSEKSLRLLVLLVNQSYPPRVLGTVYLGKMNPPQNSLPCRNCRLVSTCKSGECYESRNIGPTHINWRKLALGRNNNGNHNKNMIKSWTLIPGNENGNLNKMERKKIAQEQEIPTLYKDNQNEQENSVFFKPDGNKSLSNLGDTVLNTVSQHVKKNLIDSESEFPSEKNKNTSVFKLNDGYSKIFKSTLKSSGKNGLYKNDQNLDKRQELWENFGGKIFKNLLISKIFPKVDLKMGMVERLPEKANIIRPTGVENIKDASDYDASEAHVIQKPLLFSLNGGNVDELKRIIPGINSEFNNNKILTKYNRNEYNNAHFNNDKGDINELIRNVVKNENVDKKSDNTASRTISKFSSLPIANSKELIITDELEIGDEKELRNKQNHNPNKYFVEFLTPEGKTVRRNFLNPKYRQYNQQILNSEIIKARHKYDKINSWMKSHKNSYQNIFNDKYVDEVLQETDKKYSIEEENVPGKYETGTRVRSPINYSTYDTSKESAVEDVEDILGTRILGGNAATSSGTPVVSKGRSGLHN